jgi:hypothetical protein
MAILVPVNRNRGILTSLIINKYTRACLKMLNKYVDTLSKLRIPYSVRKTKAFLQV